MLKPHKKSVSNNKKLQITSIYSFIFPLQMFFSNSAGSAVSILALLNVLLCRVFLHHMSLEILTLIALVVACRQAKGFSPVQCAFVCNVLGR